MTDLGMSFSRAEIQTIFVVMLTRLLGTRGSCVRGASKTVATSGRRSENPEAHNEIIASGRTES
jgi:hypothetical protein